MYAIVFTIGIVSGCELTLFLLCRWLRLIDGCQPPEED